MAATDDVIMYATLLQEYIEELSHHKISVGEVEPQVIVQNGHYLLLQLGWQGVRRIHGLTLHARLHDDKIWIEYDGAPPPGLAQWLVERGVPREAIVLAFHPQSVRALSGFAVA